MQSGGHQIQSGIMRQGDTEQGQGVVPKLTVVTTESGVGFAVRIGVVDKLVFHGDAAGHDLWRTAALHQLSPDRIVGRKDHQCIVGGVEAVHPQIVPGQQGVIAAGSGD